MGFRAMLVDALDAPLEHAEITFDSMGSLIYSSLVLAAVASITPSNA